MAAACALLALFAVLAASAVADPLADPLDRAGVAVADKNGPLGFDLNELLASLLAHFDPFDIAPQTFDVDVKEIR